MSGLSARALDLQQMTKSELRKTFFKRRTELSAVERASKSRKITELFIVNIELAGVKVLHCFIPIEKFNEVDTEPIIRIASSRQIAIAVPRVNFETGEIESFAYPGETELVENAWGIREPAGGHPIDPTVFDVVVVPLLCVDKRGFRVGYGKGFYDRFLERCRPDCRKVGLSFFPPVETIEDTFSGDVRLDLCITPECFYRIT